MKNFIVIIAVLFISACSFTKPHESLLQTKAQESGLVAATKSHFDASFIAPGATLQRYREIRIDTLDLSQVKIINPEDRHNNDRPWELTADDKRYYQEKYSDAVKKNLLESGLYKESAGNGENVLLLKAKIIEIAPLASKDDFQSRPNRLDVYTKGFGRMTIVFELYDSVSNKPLFTATDESDLGSIWEKNTRAQNNVQIRAAFEYWLNDLRLELQQLTK